MNRTRQKFDRWLFQEVEMLKPKPKMFELKDIFVFN